MASTVACAADVHAAHDKKRSGRFYLITMPSGNRRYLREADGGSRRIVLKNSNFRIECCTRTPLAASMKNSLGALADLTGFGTCATLLYALPWHFGLM